MILVILFIGTVAACVGICWNIECFDWRESVGMILGAIGLIIAIGAAIAAIFLTCSAVNTVTIDEKIAMYQEENQTIEFQIAETVKQYQEYETGIFTEVAPDKSVALVSLYPELKSDTLVQKQIEGYIANNEKIKSLKESQITAPIIRWWAYFGK